MIARRLAGLAAGVLLALCATPGTASAVDTVFDPADAQELAGTLTEAAQEQGICYGWRVSIDDQWAGVDTGESVGSNFGAGIPVTAPPPGSPRCNTVIEFTSDILYTSESSESEDSASYGVISNPRGPTTEDLDELELVDEEGLIGDNVDTVVYKAVAALPLLAADTGLAKPLVATPAPEAAAGDSRLTDSPGSDFLRGNGNLLLWGGLLLLGGVAFAVYALRNSRREARAKARASEIFRRRTQFGSVPDYPPPNLSPPQYPPPQYPPGQGAPPQYPPPQYPSPQDPPPQDPGTKE